MKKILFIQFRTTQESIASEKSTFLNILNQLDTEINFTNALLDPIDWNKPAIILQNIDGVILGGSGELYFDGGDDCCEDKRKISHELIDKMSPFFKYIEDCDFPTLAICFGHQIIAKSQGVKIIRDKVQAKIGTHEVSLTKEAKSDPIFSGIPENFNAQYMHKDSVVELPNKAVLLAQGECCFHSALRYGRNRYSIQFHPELNEENIIQKFKLNPDYVPKDVNPDDLVKTSPHATKILLNFVEYLPEN
jgi:GMP synthase-like glutamine amidotransferase